MVSYTPLACLKSHFHLQDKWKCNILFCWHVFANFFVTCVVDSQVLRLGIIFWVSGSGNSRKGAEGDEEICLPLICLHLHIFVCSSYCEYNSVLYTVWNDFLLQGTTVSVSGLTAKLKIYTVYSKSWMNESQNASSTTTTLPSHYRHWSHVLSSVGVSGDLCCICVCGFW